MFLAHLPAGYLLSRALLSLPDTQRLPQASRCRLLACGLIASILPDLDLLYLYCFSEHGFNHRAFPTHWPLLWLALFLSVALLFYGLRQREWQWHNLFLLANVQLHFVLDTIAGPIRWLAPFDQTRFAWMHVPRQPGWWVWSYVSHVSALIEVLIIAAASWLAWRTVTQHRAPVSYKQGASHA